MKKIYQKRSTCPASRVLHAGFPIILIQLCVITAALVFGEHENHLYALRLYYQMLEYILLDVVLVIGGAILFEVAERDTGNRQ